jgi:hypothetical protein
MGKDAETGRKTVMEPRDSETATEPHEKSLF